MKNYSNDITVVLVSYKSLKKIKKFVSNLNYKVLQEIHNILIISLLRSLKFFL